MTAILAPRAITRSADHRYTYAGHTYPGVTSILDKTVDKSGPLMAWAARQTAEAAVELHTRLDGSTLNAFDTLLTTVGAEGVIKALTATSSWKKDEAAKLGTEVHHLADELINGRLDMSLVPAHTRDHIKHYADWWKASGWKVRTSEAMVVHDRMGYGGTLDLLCYDHDRRTVLADIKTGRNVYDTAALQLTAYGLAELIQTPEGALYPMPKVDRYAILHVTATGVREIEVPVGTLEEMAWGACLDLFAWKETTKGKRL